MPTWLTVVLAALSMFWFFVWAVIVPYSIYYDVVQQSYIIDVVNIRIGAAGALALQLPMEVLVVKRFSPLVRHKIALFGGLFLDFIVLLGTLKCSERVMELALEGGRVSQRVAYESSFVPVFLMCGLFWLSGLTLIFFGMRIAGEARDLVKGMSEEPLGSIQAAFLTLLYLFPASIIYMLMR